MTEEAGGARPRFAESKIVAGLLYLFLLVCAAPVLLCGLLLASTADFAAAEPPLVTWAVDLFDRMQDLPLFLVEIVGPGLPMFIGAVIFMKKASNDLEIHGVITLVYIAVMLLFGMVFLAWLDPADADQSDNFLRGREGLRVLEESLIFTCQTCVGLLALITGLKLRS